MKLNYLISQKTVRHYCLAVILLLGLLVSLITLLPQTRQFICTSVQLILHKELQNQQLWLQRLLIFALLSSFSFMLFYFLFFTPIGRKLINKSETEDKIKSRNYSYTLKNILFPENFFEVFVLFFGCIVVIITFFRAANTGITYDEAYTYINYVLPNIFDSLFKGQLLNNHILNSLCIRIVVFFSQAKYHELFIRFPNLVFYCIYIIFSYLIAKEYKNRYFIFVLFISNYYLNEFFGLARGYGMACACLTGTYYFFDKWKKMYENKRPDSYPFFLFLLFCSLAALSNSITLYIIFCFLVLINFKYKKDIVRLINIPFFMIFILAALHTVFVSGVGYPIFSTHSIYDSIISIPNMFTVSLPLSFFIGILFFIFFLNLLIKTKAKNDYCLLLIIFVVVCIVSQLVFRRGYPVEREMIPFYPIFIVIIANAIEYIPNIKITKPIFIICTFLFCFQFVVKVDIKKTRDWNDDYLIRNTIYTYIGEHGIDDKEKFRSFMEYKQYHPSVDFYVEKAEWFMENRAGE